MSLPTTKTKTKNIIVQNKKQGEGRNEKGNET
jgi:hypothetical protein